MPHAVATFSESTPGTIGMRTWRSAAARASGLSPAPSDPRIRARRAGRGRTATALACLHEALAITAKLPSGYHRDLQLLKAPLFRGIDLALETCAVMAHALAGVRFRREHIELDPSLFATEEAYRLVLDEGIPFREAYRRVASRWR